MADELTGPGTADEDVEVRYVFSEDAATPDEEAAEPTTPPAVDPLDLELAKQLNVDQLPADPQELKQLVAKRYTELRTGTRKAFDERAEAEKQMAELKGKVDALTAVTAGQHPQRKELPDWVKSYKAPDGASEAEVLFDFVQYVNQHTVEPKLQQAEQMAYTLGMERVNNWLGQAKAKAGSESDWETVEPKVQYALERGFTPDEALDFALANTGLIGERIKREIAQEQAAKRQAVGGAPLTPGVTRTSEKTPGDPRKITMRDWAKWAAEESERELARQ